MSFPSFKTRASKPRIPRLPVPMRDSSPDSIPDGAPDSLSGHTPDSLSVPASAGILPDETRISDATHVSGSVRIPSDACISGPCISACISDETRISDATRISTVTKVAAQCDAPQPNAPDAAPSARSVREDATGSVATPTAGTPAEPIAESTVKSTIKSTAKQVAKPTSKPIAMPRTIEEFRQGFTWLEERISSEIIGKPVAVRRLLTVLFAGGHMLLEDEPGTGKTRLARAAARSVGVSFGRIQFTPDLLPSDVVGVTLYDQHTGRFSWRKGPVFASLVLADEINRASPKTQSALLEVMEEEQVTIDGITHGMPQPFMVVATQNPSNHLGTYALPEAQLDRFMMRMAIGHPDRESSLAILRNDIRSRADESSDTDGSAIPRGQERTESAGRPISDGAVSNQSVANRAAQDHTASDHASAWVLAMRSVAEHVHLDDAIGEYIIRLVEATRDDRQVETGASLRGALALSRCARVTAAADGRDHVLPDDVAELAVPVLAHRLVLTAETICSQVSQNEVMRRILDQVPVPSIGGERSLP